MKKTATSILLATAVGALSLNAQNTDCLAVAQAVSVEVSADRSLVLEIVSTQIAESTDCACEVVKSAITASEADAPTVAAIVGAAISESPEQMRLISQCAIAVAPDAIGAIQALLATLDPNSGKPGSGSKDAKAAAGTDDETAAADFNPLNFPGEENSPVSSPNFSFGPEGENAPPGVNSAPIINAPPITDPNP